MGFGMRDVVQVADGAPGDTLGQPFVVYFGNERHGNLALLENDMYEPQTTCFKNTIEVIASRGKQTVSGPDCLCSQKFGSLSNRAQMFRICRPILW